MRLEENKKKETEMLSVQAAQRYVCPGSKKLLEGKEDQPVHERLYSKAIGKRDEGGNVKGDDPDNLKETFRPKTNNYQFQVLSRDKAVEQNLYDDAVRR